MRKAEKMNTATQMVADYWYSTDGNAAYARRLVKEYGHNLHLLTEKLQEATLAMVESSKVNNLTRRFIMLAVEDVHWYGVAKDVRSNA